jgi:hypothetical protein
VSTSKPLMVSYKFEWHWWLAKCTEEYC